MAGTQNTETRSKPETKPLSKCYGNLLLLIRLWGFVLTVAGVTVSIFTAHVLNYRSATISHPDMIDVKSTLGGYQTFLCEGTTVRSMFSSFKAYRLDHTPKVDNSGRDRFNLKSTLTMYLSDTIVKRSFHVLEGSEIIVKACSNRPSLVVNETLKVLILEGQQTFDKWAKTKQSDDPAIQSHIISSNYDCANTTSYQIYLNAPSTDSYFFVYQKLSVAEDISFQIDYDLNLVRYDVSSASVECESVRSCDVAFALNSDANVVLQFEPGDDQIFYSSKCSFRVGIALSMFLAVPSGIALILSGVILWSEKKSDNSSDVETSNGIETQTPGIYSQKANTDYNTQYSESITNF